MLRQLEFSFNNKNCIKRKVYINFAQVTKLALLHDDDNDDNDDNNDNDDNDDNDDYDDDDDNDNDDDRFLIRMLCRQI